MELRFLGRMSREKVEWLWTKWLMFPQLTDDFAWKDWNIFMAVLTSPHAIFYEVYTRFPDPVGMVWFMNVKPGATADMYVAFWGATTKEERREAIRKVGVDIIHRCQIRRAGAHAYTTNTPVIRLLEEMGAKLDGTLRKAAMFRGELVDVAAYSILSHEFLAWAGNPEWDPAGVTVPDQAEGVDNGKSD